MIKFWQVAIIAALCTSAVYSQTQTSKLFYSGKEWPNDIFLWIWGFSELPVEVPDKGYTPGTPAFRWGTELTWRDNQGLFFGFHAGLDLSNPGSEDFVQFKLRAPNGVSSDNTLSVLLYDQNWSSSDEAAKYLIPNYQDLNDGEWHQFKVPYSEFLPQDNIDWKNVGAVSFETMVNTNSDLFYIDDVWIGNPDVKITMTLFDGMNKAADVDSEVKGFLNNTLVIAEGEGFTQGSNAVLWENNNVDGYQNAGIGFTFRPQDFSYGFTRGVSRLKIKIKAPADINDLMLVWKDRSENAATILLDTAWIPDSVWNGEWQNIQIPLDSFSVAPELNMRDIYYFSISPDSAAIPERILIDDIWVGEPVINNMPPPETDSIIVDINTDYVNYVSWINIPTIEGETYNLYGSPEPITNLNDNGVVTLGVGISEGVYDWVTFNHYIHHPHNDGNTTYYYAVETIDAAGRISESFKALNTPYTNTGKAKGIISLEVPDFNADGDLSEWSSFVDYDLQIDTVNANPDSLKIDTTYIYKDIVLFKMRPDQGYYWGSISGPRDYSADVYLAMDNENVYLAVDVWDDVFAYRAENTQNWWEDEAIELFLGLYELKFMHSSMLRGEEPDYRIVLRPDSMFLPDKSTIPNGVGDYFFEIPDTSTGYDSSYVIEAKIPFQSIQLQGDAVFTPTEGMTIPFEVYATDSDVPNGGAEGRLQLGDNYALNPFGDGPKVWTFAWIDRPEITDVDEILSVPYEFSLSQNYPNPFNPSTTINFTLPNTADVSLVVYNTLGQKVTTLLQDNMIAGKHSVIWNGRDNSGRLASSGVYFYRLVSGKTAHTKKMILLK